MRPQSTTVTPPPSDPFASLVSASSRHPSPFPSGVSSQQPASAGPSLLDLAGASSPQPPAGNTKAAEEDEWDFTSSLPESNTLPTTNRVQVLNSSLRVEFVARRQPQQARQIHMVALFSNGTNQPLSELHFQVAVEKVSYRGECTEFKVQGLMQEQAYNLQLRPQSGRDIAPLQVNGVQQEMLVSGVEAGKGNSIKMRFKVSYRVGNEQKEEQGMVPSLGIA